MPLSVYLEAQLLEINATFWIEAAAFILSILVLYYGVPPLGVPSVYRRVIDAAERRQRQVGQQLEAAEKARKEAEERREQAEARLREARAQASQIVEGANKSAEQLRAELKQKAEDEAKRITETARREIDAERQQAVDQVRAEVAELVVAATEKVLGESLDQKRQYQLIERAIKEVGGDGRRG